MQLKKINPKITLYHCFERSLSEMILFDDEMDIPIAYGSKVIIQIKMNELIKINPNITIVYYERGLDKSSYKKTMIYKGKPKENNSEIKLVGLRQSLP